MKRRIFVFLIMCVFMFGFTVSPGVFSRVYVVDRPVSVTGGEMTEEIEIPVKTQSELMKFGKDTIYHQIVPTNVKRATLVLKNDIKLTNDIVLTADTSLDLGGHELDLGEHTLTVRHPYSGSFIMENGTLKNGLLQLNTPSAVWNKGGKLTMQDIQESRLTLQEAAQEFLTKTLYGNGYSYGGDDLAFHGDLGLPVRYGTLGTYSYKYSDTGNLADYLDAAGCLKKPIENGGANGNLEVEFIPEEGEPFSLTAPLIRLFAADDDKNWAFMYCTWMEKAYGAKPVNSVERKYDLALSTAVQLPKKGYWKQDVSYELVNPIPESVGTGFLVQSDHAVRFNTIAAKEAGMESCDIVVTYGSVKITFHVTLTDGIEIEEDKELIAVLNEMFGTREKPTLLVVKPDEKDDTEFTSFPLNVSDPLKMLGLTDVDAELLNNFYGNYTIEIDDNGEPGRLRVTEGKIPLTDGEFVDLLLTLTIREGGGPAGTPVPREPVRIRLQYIEEGGSSELSGFGRYHPMFEQSLLEQTHLLYEIDGDFLMPATYTNGKSPFVAYRLRNTRGYVSESDSHIKITFIDKDGNERTPIFDDGSKDTSEVVKKDLFSHFEGLTSEASLDLFTKESKWKFDVDEIAVHHAADVELMLEYQYCFAEKDVNEKWLGEWARYRSVKDGTLITSKLTVLGMTYLDGAFENVTGCDFDNEKLYDTLKKALAPAGFAYLPLKYLQAPIERLSVKKLLFPTTDTTKPNGDLGANGYEQDSVGTGDYVIGNYKWIAHLTNTQYLDLHGMHMTAESLAYVVQLRQLTGLDVSGIRVDGRSYTEQTESRSPAYHAWTADLGDEELQSIVQRLPNLQELNISYCRMSRFVSLSGMPNLKVCYLQGNEQYGGSPNDVGSMGKMNQIALVMLAANTTVYRWVPPTMAAELKNLEPLEDITTIANQVRGRFSYQRKLPVGTDLDEVAKSLISDVTLVYNGSLKLKGNASDDGVQFDGRTYGTSGRSAKLIVNKETGTITWEGTYKAYEGEIKIVFTYYFEFV